MPQNAASLGSNKPSTAVTGSTVIPYWLKAFRNYAQEREDRNKRSGLSAKWPALCDAFWRSGLLQRISVLQLQASIKDSFLFVKSFLAIFLNTLLKILPIIWLDVPPVGAHGAGAHGAGARGGGAHDGDAP